ncbi:MAG TPA: UDP-N-acetylglucosamine 2-epimerase, partial [Candidatus Elarobacter sp.]
KSMGLGTIAFAESYARARPDVLLAVGDRFEMHAAVMAALPFGIPVAHVHGGEVTEGAIDDALRHGITKVAHLHFTSTQTYRERVIQLGEEPWRVTVSGAPSLDNLRTVRLLSRAELAARLGVPFDPAPLLVTFHPVTREIERTPAQIDALLAALHALRHPAVFTLPNADTGGQLVAQRVRAFVASHTNAWIADNLGTEAYFSVMNLAAAMAGNSSSGIIEASSFELPVVNVGSRQAGRIRAANVIDVDDDAASIHAGLQRALHPEFRAALRGLTNPYDGGDAAAAIVARLRDEPLGDRLMRKRFHDVPVLEPHRG